MGDQSTTTAQSIPEASGQSQRMLQMLERMMGGAKGQMGDLSRLARGDVGTATEAERASVRDAQTAAGDTARLQMEQALRETLGTVEGSMLDRGMEGSSIEAVTNALIGQDFQRQMAQILSQGQSEAAGQLVNIPFQRAGTQLNANQLLLQRLMGGAQVALPYDMQARMGQMSTRTSQPMGQVLLEKGMDIGSSYLTGTP